MTEPPDRELAVFSAARRLPVAERAAYLEEACAGDASLRRRLEELLKANEEVGVFLESPLATPPGPGGTVRLPKLPTEKPGDWIGRYKLLQQIGEGGCGIVYMAEQEEPVRRRVALKVIKLGMDTKSVIARFEAERQALALMDHPNIAKVLDAGATDAGRPYFVMELVRGIKITDYCDQNNLPTRERLDLFIQVCRAIQHAHQKGIIHRDIKPANILVTVNDGVPVPKVIDFGIAKATQGRLTDRTLFTAFEQFIGTPAYMSPEQAAMTSLDIDTRSDIYSLGVLLYELLTGKTPFDAKALLQSGLDAMRRTIREVAPPKPSARLSTMLDAERATTASQRQTEPLKLIHLVRGDLDWIVMKCLEKERGRRYETANGLAADIKRHLNTEPVVARPPSKFYEFQKTVRRHKVGFAATVAVIVVLALGIIMSTWQAVRATRAKAQAVAEKERADREASVANRATEFMRQMLATANPDSSKRPGYTFGQMLDDFAKAIDVQFADDPEVAAELHNTIGQAYANMQEDDKARLQLAKALELRVAADGTNDARYADSLVDYGSTPSVNPSAAELEECEVDLRRALAIYHACGIRGSRVVHALWALQTICDREGKFNEVETVVTEAQAEARQFPGTNYGDLTAMNTGLIGAKTSEGKYAEAEKIARDTIASDIRLFGPDNIQTAWAYHALCGALLPQSKCAEALAAAKQALAIMRKRISPKQVWYGYPLYDVLVTLNTARSARALTNLCSSANELDKLESLFQERLESKPLLPDNPADPVNVAMQAVPQFPGLYLELATELSAAGRTNEAAEFRRKAVALLEQLQTENADKPNLLAQLYLERIQLFVDQGEFDEAKEYTAKLLALKHLNAEPLNDVAWALATSPDPRLRDGSNAVIFAIQAIAATGRANARYLDTLAAAYAEVGQFTNAVLIEQEAMSLLANEANKQDYATRLSLYQSAISYRDSNALAANVYALLQDGKFAEAEPKARECLALREKLIPNDWRTFNAASLLGGSLLGQKKYAEAEPLLLSGYDGLKEREDKIPPNGTVRPKEARQRLVQLYEATGQMEKAAEMKKELDASNLPAAK